MKQTREQPMFDPPYWFNKKTDKKRINKCGDQRPLKKRGESEKPYEQETKK